MQAIRVALILILCIIDQAWIKNTSEVNSTFVNKKEIKQAVELRHMDIFTINDRSFRFEYPELVKVGLFMVFSRHPTSF